MKFFFPSREHTISRKETITGSTIFAVRFATVKMGRDTAVRVQCDVNVCQFRRSRSRRVILGFPSKWTSSIGCCMGYGFKPFDRLLGQGVSASERSARLADGRISPRKDERRGRRSCGDSDRPGEPVCTERARCLSRPEEAKPAGYICRECRAGSSDYARQPPGTPGRE